MFSGFRIGVRHESVDNFALDFLVVSWVDVSFGVAAFNWDEDVDRIHRDGDTLVEIDLEFVLHHHVPIDAVWNRTGAEWTRSRGVLV